MNGVLKATILFIISVSFISCSFRATGSSIEHRLSEVDALISVQDYNGAWSLLKKISRTIKNPTESLGLVRRALLLGRNDFAKKILEDSLKSSPDNYELLSVYSHMLMREKNYTEAFEYAKKLEGTQYGSIYSELRFILDVHDINSKNENIKDSSNYELIDYYAQTYVQQYVDIANSVGNTSYLRNAAIINALEGNMSKAYTYHPELVTAYDTPEFWAVVSYDAHMFSRVIQNLLQFDLNISQKEILADSYVHIGDIENAKLLWEDSTITNPYANPTAWHNLALYSHRNFDFKTSNESVVHLVDNFPEYIGGLTMYARFSLFDEPMPSNSVFSDVLELQGAQTLQMQANETSVSVSSVDALQKINDAIESLILVDENAAMQLVIEKLKFIWDSSQTQLNERQKISQVWSLLEEYRKEPYGYNTNLVQYAIWFFLSQQMINEAEGLFKAHCDERYSAFADNNELYSTFPVAGMAYWEYEYGAYIALMQKDYMQAELWLTSLIKNDFISADMPVGACLNLISLYYGQGKKQQALLLSGQLLEYLQDDYIIANVYYTIALIQYELGDTSRAKNSLSEALRYDTYHSAARLLQKKITD